MQTDAQIVAECRHEQDLLIGTDPVFADWFEDVDIFVCTRAELVAGMRLAQTPELRQMLLSVLQMRETIGLATSRPFV